MGSRRRAGRPTADHSPPLYQAASRASLQVVLLKATLRSERCHIVTAKRARAERVRDAIKRYQPVAGLHGHIHESRGAQRIGRTLCVNPGSDYSSGVLRGAVIDLAQDGSCLNFLLTTG